MDVPRPEPTLRSVEYEDPIRNCAAEPTLDACGRGCLEGGRPIPSAACCLGIVADTARGACTGRTEEEPRTGTGIAILLGAWPAPALDPPAERGTKLGTWVVPLVSASRGLLLGTDRDCEQPMLDAGRTAGVIAPFPGAEFGVVVRGGTEPARGFAPRRFSLSATPAALSRICSMLSPFTR